MPFAQGGRVTIPPISDLNGQESAIKKEAP